MEAVSVEESQEVRIALTEDWSGQPLPEPIEFWVEARADSDQQVGALDLDSANLDKVFAAIKTVSGSVANALRAARPDKFSVEMAFTIKAEAGGLVALLVRSGGEATIKVTVEWEPQKPEV